MVLVNCVWALCGDSDMYLICDKEVVVRGLNETFEVSGS